MIGINYNEYQQTLEKNMRLIRENSRLEEANNINLRIKAELGQEIERLNNIIQATRNNIIKDISMIKTHKDMSKEEIITRLESTLIILDRK